MSIAGQGYDKKNCEAGDSLAIVEPDTNEILLGAYCGVLQNFVIGQTYRTKIKVVFQSNDDNSVGFGFYMRILTQKLDEKLAILPATTPKPTIVPEESEEENEEENNEESIDVETNLDGKNEEIQGTNKSTFKINS